MILGVSEYAKLKISIVSRVGKLGELVVEFTFFGWIIMFLGVEINLSSVYLIRSFLVDYE